MAESGELGSAVNAYIERIRADRNIVPCHHRRPQFRFAAADGLTRDVARGLCGGLSLPARPALPKRVALLPHTLLRSCAEGW